MNGQSRRQSMIWGALLIILGVVALLDRFIDLTVWVWVAILGLSGLALLGLYFLDRRQVWLLIPAYVTLIVAALIALLELDILRGVAVPGFVLGAIALPFLIVYLLDREQWWALIPAYVLLAVGLMVVLLEGVLDGLLVPAYVMFAIALPFFFVFIRNREHWWALIPAGIMSVIGLSFLISGAAIEWVLPVGLIVAGLILLARQFLAQPAPAEKAKAEEMAAMDAPMAESSEEPMAMDDDSPQDEMTD